MNFLINPELRQVWNKGSAAELLGAYEKVWDRKRVLRKIYENWYQQILAELCPGAVLEIGAGTGNFKRWLEERNRRCWTLDILPGQHVNVRADALQLPFRPGSVQNVVMIDALHHFARPFGFLEQVAKLLPTGGRMILLEPFVSWWGAIVWRFLHHERVDFGFEETATPKDAWDGNAAIPQLVLSEKNRANLPLKTITLKHAEFLSYPLSGGFLHRALLPERLLLGLHQLEQCRLFQNRFVSLRIFAVLEKTA